MKIFTRKLHPFREGFEDNIPLKRRFLSGSYHPTAEEDG